MKSQILGESELEITSIGIGTWAIGGPWQFGWSHQDDSESIGAIHRALDEGINWIDTAPAYGLGHAEEVVARALRESSHRPLVFTKCGIVWNDARKPSNTLEPVSVTREVEDSLRRLDVETLDLCQIHWPIPDAQIEGACEALEQLRLAGKIRYVGVSNFSVEQMERARSMTQVTSLQPPYSLVQPEIGAAELPYCLENGIGVINYSPMGSGLLSGTMTRERVAALPDDDWRKSSPKFKEPKLTRGLDIAKALQAVADQHLCTVAEAAIAWTLKHPAITAAIVGLRRPEQVQGVIRAAEIELTEPEMESLSDLAYSASPPSPT